MVNRVIIGGQFGDEGKGKLIHALAQSMVDTGLDTLVHRYQGGPNAGHTLTNSDGQKIILHMIPSGAAVEGTYNLLGANTVTEPFDLLKEMRSLESLGYSLTQENFGISTESTVILPHHKDADKKNLKHGSQQSKHVSTGRGIRQAYADKMNHLSLRMGELGSRTSIEDALEKRLNWETEFMKSRGVENFKIHPSFFPHGVIHSAIIDSLLDIGETLAPYMVNEGKVLNNLKWSHKLFEGAQGNGLDANYGWHPGTTSSSPSADAPARDFKTFGVFKAYMSSVGHGHRGFVSQMPQEHEDLLRHGWQEFGATTKLPRSIGYFDLVQASQSVNSGVGIDFIAMTCMDRLKNVQKVGIPLRMVVAYDVDGQIFEKWSSVLDDRSTRLRATPVFEEFDMNDKNWEQKYLGRIESHVQRPIVFVGNGPKKMDYTLGPGADILDGTFRNRFS